MPNLNDEAWEAFWSNGDFSSRLENEGFFEVDARDLKPFREPRLMAKFDHLAQMPILFRENQIGILPISNSRYRVGFFNTFTQTPQNLSLQRIKTMRLPEELETLQIGDIGSEAAAINAALASGVIQDFVGDAVVPTQFGRQRSGNFKFSIPSSRQFGAQSLEVKGAQIEIDAGLESGDGFYLVEAKRYLPDDFNARQLYYPFRTWEARISKTVTPIFLSFTNDVYTLVQYQVESIEDYSSMTPTKVGRYSLSDVSLEKEDLVLLLERPPLESVQGVPFPQADDFDKVLSLVEYLSSSDASAEQIAHHFGVDIRQSDYYFNAARYFGWVDVSIGDSGRYRHASLEGSRLSTASPKERNFEVAEKMLSISTLRWAFSYWVKCGVRPSKDEMLSVFIQSKEAESISGETLSRRVRTISSWLDWLLSLVGK